MTEGALIQVDYQGYLSIFLQNMVNKPENLRSWKMVNILKASLNLCKMRGLSKF